MGKRKQSGSALAENVILWSLIVIPSIGVLSYLGMNAHQTIANSKSAYDNFEPFPEGEDRTDQFYNATKTGPLTDVNAESVAFVQHNKPQYDTRSNTNNYYDTYTPSTSTTSSNDNSYEPPSNNNNNNSNTTNRTVTNNNKTVTNNNKTVTNNNNIPTTNNNRGNIPTGTGGSAWGGTKTTPNKPPAHGNIGNRPGGMQMKGPSLGKNVNGKTVIIKQGSANYSPKPKPKK